jgi:hypothetical protein
VVVLEEVMVARDIRQDMEYRNQVAQEVELVESEVMV